MRGPNPRAWGRILWQERGPLLGALACGILLIGGFAPFNLWPLLAIAPAGLFLLGLDRSRAACLRQALAFGLGLFGAGVSWVYVSIHQFGSAPPPLALALTGLFVLGLTLLFILPQQLCWHGLCKPSRQAPIRAALGFAGCWVLFEWLRSWVLTGFPWLFLGTGAVDAPLRPWLPVLGIYGVSLLLVLCGTLAACLGLSLCRQRARTAPAMLLGILLLGSGAPLGWLGQQQWTHPVGNLKVAAVQANIPQSLKWDPGFVQTTLDRYLSMSQPLWDADLLIWPENAIPVLYPRAKGLIDRIQTFQQQQNATLITGLPFMEPGADGAPRYYNGVMSVQPEQTARYYKQKLVPFGEFVPLETLLRGLIAFLDLPMSAFSRGSAEQAPLPAGPWKLAPFICYEVVYPDFVLQQARDTELLITLSNDTWFGQSIGPKQHFQIARAMSAQTGRAMVRATNDGISALIRPDGSVATRIAQYQPGILQGSVELRQGLTPAMQWSSTPTLALALLLVLFSGLRCMRTRTRSAEASS